MIKCILCKYYFETTIEKTKMEYSSLAKKEVSVPYKVKSHRCGFNPQSVQLEEGQPQCHHYESIRTDEGTIINSGVKNINGNSYLIFDGNEGPGCWNKGDFHFSNIGNFEQVDDSWDMEDLRQGEIIYRPIEER